MKEFIACGVQIAITPNDVNANIKKVLVWLEKAAIEHKAELIVFPESVTSGFTPCMPVEEFYEKIADTVPGRITDTISAACKKFGVHVVLPMYEKGPQAPIVYNSSVLIGPVGEIIGSYHKTHAFPIENVNYGGWTTPGTEAQVYDTALGKIGMIICYDGDFPELSRELTVKGAEIITRPSAFLRSFEIWDLTSRARAYDNHVYVVAVNAVGTDAGGGFYGGQSMIITPIAQKLAQARGTEEIVSATLSPDPIRYISYGSKASMIFDHVEDRNLEVYKTIMKPSTCAFEPQRISSHIAAIRKKQVDSVLIIAE